MLAYLTASAFVPTARATPQLLHSHRRPALVAALPPKMTVGNAAGGLSKLRRQLRPRQGLQRSVRALQALQHGPRLLRRGGPAHALLRARLAVGCAPPGRRARTQSWAAGCAER